MKKRLLLCLFLSLILTVSVFPVQLTADSGLKLESWKITGVNCECRTANTVVYTGTGATGTDEKCTDVRVGQDGRVLSVSGGNAEIPEGGFVVSSIGVKAKKLALLQPGDGVLFNERTQTVTLIPQSYSPFTEKVISFTALDKSRSADTTIIYTKGETTGTNAWGYEVTVSADGFVIAVDGNNSPIPEGGFVISGHGAGKTALSEAARLGMHVTYDENQKTICFSVDSAACLKSVSLQIERYEAEAASAKDNYAVLDFDAIEEYRKKLNEVCGKIEASLQSADMVSYYIQLDTFNELMIKAKAALIEEKPVEARAVWLRPSLSASSAEIVKTVKSIYEAGYNQLFLEILFDNTTIMPVPETCLYEQNPVFNGADILKMYIDACHAYRIECHAWYSVCRVGHEGSKNTFRSVGVKKPEWLQIQKNGKTTVTNTYGSAYFLNPALQEVRDYLTIFAKWLAENYDLDGIHLDYIRYPNNNAGEDFGYDDYTCSLFREQTGTDPKDLTQNTSAYTEFCKFRAGFVTELVRSIRDEVRKVRPDIYLSAAVAPGYANTIGTMQQDSAKWIQDGLLDIVMPMAYGTTDIVEKYVAENADLVTEKTYLITGVTDYGADIYLDQILATRNGDSDGIAFFSWSTYTDDYQLIRQTAFVNRSLSPTWDAKEAMLAQISLLQKRLTGPMKNLDTGKIEESLASLQKALQSGSINECETEIKGVLAAFDYFGKDLPENAKKQISSDLLTIRKLQNLNRDQARNAYLEEHPLPACLIQETADESGEESLPAEESTRTPVELNGFEKAAQIISLAVIFGGIVLIPVYYLLVRRRRRLLKEYEETQKNSDADTSDSKSDDSNQE